MNQLVTRMNVSFSDSSPKLEQRRHIRDSKHQGLNLPPMGVTAGTAVWISTLNSFSRRTSQQTKRQQGSSSKNPYPKCFKTTNFDRFYHKLGEAEPGQIDEVSNYAMDNVSVVLLYTSNFFNVGQHST